MWRGRNDKDDGRNGSANGSADGKGGGTPYLRPASPEDLRNDIRSGKIRPVGGSGADPTFSTFGNGSYNPTGVDDWAGLDRDEANSPPGDLPPSDWTGGYRLDAAVGGGDPGRSANSDLTLAADDRSGHEPPSDRPSRDLGVFTNVSGQDSTSRFVGPEASTLDPLRPVGSDGPNRPEDPRFVGDEPQSGRPPHPADSGFSPGPARGGLRAVDSSGANPDPWAGPDDTWSSSWSPTGPQGDEAGQPRPPKLELAPPVEPQPSRGPILALGALAVVLLGLGALYYFVIRSDDSPVEDGTVAADDAQEADSAGDTSGDDAVDQAAGAGSESDGAGSEPVGPTSLDPNPVLSLEGADSGPLETETAYPTMLEGAPVDSEYMVIVDGREQGEPIDYLPDLVLPEGRHSILMEVTYQAETATTNAVEVYVLTPELVASYRANLSSVSVQEQGWGEALRQFDEFRAAGHEQLRLSPSDPYPSLLPGYWNIYVDGFASRDEAAAYCEGSGLSIPDQCFPSPFDPDAPAP